MEMEPVKDQARDSFSSFQKNISRKPISDEDIDPSIENGGAFNVAGKAEGRVFQFLQFLIGRPEF